jgi:nickel/cobalt transporter (NicO) family protein
MNMIMSRFRIIPLRLPLFAALLLALAGAALSHPLGNFTVSHYARIGIGGERLSVRYVVDMAEVSTFRELESIDTDGDRSPSKAELDAYADIISQRYRDGLTLKTDGVRLPLALIARKASVLSGDGGLPVLRIEIDLSGEMTSVAPGVVRRLEFDDANRPENKGWREMVVTTDAGIAVFDSDAYGNGVTDELKAYPKDMLASILNERQAKLSFIQGRVPAGATPLRFRDGRPVEVKSRDRLAELISVPVLNWRTAFLGLLVAAILGAFHALSPGHGKAVVGAYLIGARGTAKHAAFLGLTVTITHTAGVFALGLVTLFGANYIVPEKLFPVLTLLSGLIVVVIGLQQLRSRWRSASSHDQDINKKQEDGHKHDHLPHSHDHLHDHTHDHSHAHTHHHDGHTHSHLPPSKITWRSLLALGVSGGLLPCPSALVVLLSAIALHRIGYGLVLVLAFSAGLAGALTCVGLLFIYARRFFERPASGGAGVFVRAMPAISALVITCAGVAICLGALAQQGSMIAQLLVLLKIT